MLATAHSAKSPTLSPQHMALIPPERLTEIQKNYFDEVSQFTADPMAFPISDRRFKGRAWESGWSRTIVGMYLINSKHLLALADAVESDAKTKQRINFATLQLIDALSPANFVATNPEVLENTVQALCEKSLALGQTLARANILVWLGPAIGPSCFEVGNEVREQFIDAARLTGAGFPVETFQAIPGKPQKYWANLYHLARSRLKNAGIQAIYGGNFCTFTQSEQFFSHRRDGVSGRFAALIWLAAPRN